MDESFERHHWDKFALPRRELQGLSTFYINMEEVQSISAANMVSVKVDEVEENILTETSNTIAVDSETQEGHSNKVSKCNDNAEENTMGNESKPVDDHKDPQELKNRLLRLKQKKERERSKISNHVRIDNFQRPLIAKGLVQWLRETLNLSLNDSDVWINQIKTHCYVDFASIEDAEYCIKTVTGLKFPSTNTNTLVADFTQVSAKDAPTSEEAQLLPGKWKNAVIEKTDNQSKIQPKISGLGAAFGMMRKAVEKAAVDTQKDGTNQQHTASRKVEEIRLVKRAISPSKSESSNPTQKIILQESELPPKKTRVAENPLDKLFKKTTAKPQLYWLTVSESEIQRRRELTKLMKEKQ